MPDPPIRLRIPVIENLAVRNGTFFARDARWLSPRERQLAESIFEQSVLFDSVRIVTSPIIAAPTTFGNFIRIAPGYSLSDATLIHELTHVWQFQNLGNGYISDSLFHQVVAIVTTGDRNNAYTYVITPGRPLTFYGAEQQAMIVEDYFSKPPLQADPNYQRLIGELRRARPTLTDQDRYQETLYGPGYRNPHNDIFRDMPDSHAVNPTQTIPIFRVEF